MSRSLWGWGLRDIGEGSTRLCASDFNNFELLEGPKSRA